MALSFEAQVKFETCPLSVLRVLQHILLKNKLNVLAIQGQWDCEKSYRNKRPYASKYKKRLKTTLVMWKHGLFNGVMADHLNGKGIWKPKNLASFSLSITSISHRC
eukprot:Lithocolla_globosa_v1_NODE_4413_length_1440_cov_7.815162.p3 type:complete len:106 gc:universal NODE_4413_length_1440_cov_7.815162:896-1213(+)